MRDAAAPVTEKRQPRRRRWFQLSLRTLFLLMLLISVALGWLAMVIERGRQQRQAVAAIQNLGGHVFYPAPSTALQKSKWLSELLGSDALLSPNGVNAANAPVNDAAAANLKGLTKVTHVWLPRTHIHDAGLVNLAGMMELKQLQLSSTAVSSAGLVHLIRLTQLEVLHLDSTQVDDAGLVHLKGLAKLRHLDLSNTQVSNAGLVHLQGLTNLRELHVKGTQVTAAGISELKQALPTLQVEWP